METNNLSFQMSELHSLLEKSKEETKRLENKKKELENARRNQVEKLQNLMEKSETHLYQRLILKDRIKTETNSLKLIKENQEKCKSEIQCILEIIHYEINPILSKVNMLSVESQKLYEFHNADEVDRLLQVSSNKWNIMDLHSKIDKIRSEINILLEKVDSLHEEIRKKDSEYRIIKLTLNLFQQINEINVKIDDVTMKIDEYTELEKMLTESKKSKTIEIQSLLLETKNTIEKKKKSPSRI